MSGKGSGRASPPVLRERPPRAPIPVRGKKPKKLKQPKVTAEGPDPFVQRPRVVRSPPLALTPPASSVVGEETTTTNTAGNVILSDSESESFEDVEDGKMDELLAKLTDVVAAHGEQLHAQAETQREMAHHQRDFQETLGDVLKSHSDQLAAQVATQQAMVTSSSAFRQSLADLLRSQDDQRSLQLAQQGDFQKVVVELLAGQAHTQRQTEEQLRLLKEQMDTLRTTGRGKKERGPLNLKIYDGTGDADAHIVHYEAVGITEGWTEDDLKLGFHRTLSGMALQWFERRVSTIQTDTWTILKEAFLGYFRSPTWETDWSEESLSRIQGPKELVREYFTEKLRLIERVNPGLTEAEKVRAIHKGLRAEIKKSLKGHNHATLEKLLRKAIDIETETEGEKAEKKVDKTKETPKPPRGGTPAGRGRTARAGAEPRKPGTTAGSTPRPFGMKCFECNKMGHMAKDCKSKVGAPVVCFNCNQEGHFSRDCPERTPRSNGRVTMVQRPRLDILRPSVCGPEGHTTPGMPKTSNVVKFDLSTKRPKKVGVAVP